MSDTPQRKHKTGLGTAALFQPAQPAHPSEQPTPPTPAPALQEPSGGEPTISPRTQPQEAQTEKVKTTINLSAETLALLDALKINARRNKRKATYSDILDEAIRELAKQKGVEA